MSTVATDGIVSADESDIHDEPHIDGSRITVQFVQARVEERVLRPETVAERHNLDLADVYAALAYYHWNPEEMRQLAERREQRLSEAAERTTLTPPDE